MSRLFAMPRNFLATMAAKGTLGGKVYQNYSQSSKFLVKEMLHNVSSHVKNSNLAKYPQYIPLFACVSFAGALAVTALAWRLTREDIYLDPSEKIPPYEQFDYEHRYHIIQHRKEQLPPPEWAELRRALDRYHVRD